MKKLFIGALAALALAIAGTFGSGAVTADDFSPAIVFDMEHGSVSNSSHRESEMTGARQIAFERPHRIDEQIRHGAFDLF